MFAVHVTCRAKPKLLPLRESTKKVSKIFYLVESPVQRIHIAETERVRQLNSQ
jgi:hypothetical protein